MISSVDFPFFFPPMKLSTTGRSLTHPEGFFGNKMNSKRSELFNEFRLAAKPKPPDIFIRRLTQSPDKHVFSLHDNRNAFPRDAEHLMGGGKKKMKNLKALNENADVFGLPYHIEPPMVSSYRRTFHDCRVPISSRTLVDHYKESRKENKPFSTTIYRRDYTESKHSRKRVDEFNPRSIDELKQRRIEKMQLRQTSGSNKVKDTVAVCLQWDHEDKDEEEVLPQRISSYSLDFGNNNRARTVYSNSSDEGEHQVTSKHGSGLGHNLHSTSLPDINHVNNAASQTTQLVGIENIM